jgi:hypothetical protein
LLVAVGFYIVGLFGALGFFPIAQNLITICLAVAGGLLILGAFMRDL